MIANKKEGDDSTQYKSLAFFKKLTLFASLSNEEVKRFVDVAQVKAYKRGQILYLEGEEANAFYVICSGWIKLFNTTDEGEEVILAMLTKDSITGESALFEQGLFTSGAQVVEDVQMLSIPFLF